MAMKRVIDVRPQTRLSFKKTFQICLSGIKHRVFRSTLTLSVITLAVSFFMFLLSESAAIQSISVGVDDEVIADRIGNTWISTYFTMASNLEFTRRLASAKEDLEVKSLFIGTGLYDESNLEALIYSSHFEVNYLDYFQKLSPGKKINLVGALTGREIFEYLLDEKNQQLFRQRMQPMISLKLPSSYEELVRFIGNYKVYRKRLQSANEKWNDHVHKFDQEILQIAGSSNIQNWIIQADVNAFNTDIIPLFKKYGFEMQSDELSEVVEALAFSKDRSDIFKILTMPDKISGWNKAFLKNHDITFKMRNLGDQKVVDLLDGKYSLERLQNISEKVKYQEHLSKLEGELLVKNEGKSGSLLSGRQIFLLSISFLVCMVGITNAMLMAITERFREIATMKCLGAKDGFILGQFIMEAGLQGIVGGVLGGIIGLVITVLKGSFVFGYYFWVYFPLYGFVISAIAAFLTGIVLSVLASVYPSWSASRMAPMEAMRVE